MTRAEFDQFSRDPNNWRFGFIYFCRADPRVLVPRRIRHFGWTLNFARALALPYLYLLITTVGVLVDVARRLGTDRSASYLAEVLAGIVLVVLCYRFAGPRSSAH